MLSRFSHVQFFVTPWTAAHQAPLSMGFSKQEQRSGLPFPSPGDLPDPGFKPGSLASLALAGGFFTTNAAWEALMNVCVPLKFICWSQKWWCWEVISFKWTCGWGPYDGISALIRKDQSTCFLSLSYSLVPNHTQCEDTVKSQPSKEKKKKAIYKLSREVSPETESANALIWDVPAFRPMRSKCLLFNSPRL